MFFRSGRVSILNGTYRTTLFLKSSTPSLIKGSLVLPLSIRAIRIWRISTGFLYLVSLYLIGPKVVVIYKLNRYLDKVRKRLITILLINSMILLPLLAQTVPAGLSQAIAEGNASAMSVFFHQSLEMTILEKDYEASKNQATRIMENFYKTHPPTGFKISFEGTKEQSKYAIGTLTTKDDSFRVNLFFMNKENKRLIYYLSIEKESQFELSP